MYMKCCLSCSDKSFGLCCHFDVAYRVEKCDKKVKILKWLTQKEVIPESNMTGNVSTLVLSRLFQTHETFLCH